MAMAFYLTLVNMKKIRLSNWIPAFAIMAIIFWFSSQPSDKLPVFSWADAIIKKSGHVIGYALLAFSYWYALDMDKKRRWLAWFLAILFALTDEYHQSFVAGRHPSIWDVLIFDNSGALLSLWLTTLYLKRKRPGVMSDR